MKFFSKRLLRELGLCVSMYLASKDAASASPHATADLQEKSYAYLWQIDDPDHTSSMDIPSQYLNQQEEQQVVLTDPDPIDEETVITDLPKPSLKLFVGPSDHTQEPIISAEKIYIQVQSPSTPAPEQEKSRLLKSEESAAYLWQIDDSDHTSMNVPTQYLNQQEEQQVVLTDPHPIDEKTMIIDLPKPSLELFVEPSHHAQEPVITAEKTYINVQSPSIPTPEGEIPPSLHSEESASKDKESQVPSPAPEQENPLATQEESSLDDRAFQAPEPEPAPLIVFDAKVAAKEIVSLEKPTSVGATFKKEVPNSQTSPGLQERISLGGPAHELSARPKQNPFEGVSIASHSQLSTNPEPEVQQAEVKEPEPQAIPQQLGSPASKTKRTPKPGWSGRRQLAAAFPEIKSSEDPEIKEGEELALNIPLSSSEELYAPIAQEDEFYPKHPASAAPEEVPVSQTTTPSAFTGIHSSTTEIKPETPSKVDAVPEAEPKSTQTLAPIITLPPPPEPAPVVVQPVPEVPQATEGSVVPVEQTVVSTTPAGEEIKKEERFLINFNNVSIIEYLSFISKITNKNFVFDDADLDFKVSIVSTEPASIPNIMAALLQELRIHGLAMMEVGNSLIIHRNYKVNSPAQIVTENNVNTSHKSDLVTRVFRLNNSGTESMAQVIRPLLSELALVETAPETAHLIITDLTANVDKIAVLIESLDSSASGFEVGQYVVKNASVESAVLLAEKILTPIARDKSLVFVPHLATNSIFIVSTPYLVDRAIAILQQIDADEGTTRLLSAEKMTKEQQKEKEEAEKKKQAEQAARGEVTATGGPLGTSRWSSSLPLGHTESTKFYIKKLQYQRGDKLVESLKRIADSLLASSSQNTPLITTINSIQWLESSNSLVYTGNEASIIKITELVEEIDVPLRQILIEVLVVETTVDNSLNFGVDWGARFSRENIAGAEAFLAPSSPLTAALDTASPLANNLDPSGLARVTGFNLGVIGRNVTHCGLSFGTIGALVHALNSTNDSNIVLNPKVVVEDNMPAEIFVGINTSFQTQAIANEFGNLITSNFEFRDIGSTLKVTPLIGNNDIITLDISQEISSIVNLPQNSATSSGIGTSLPSLVGTNSVSPGPTTRKSKTTTRIHVPNEYFVILSGMIQDEDQKIKNDVPCLGGLPLIGAAFSDRDHRDTKRNLMIFIRPQIVKNDEIDKITKREQDIFDEKSRVRKRWEYQVDETLEYFNLKEMCDPQDIPP